MTAINRLLTCFLLFAGGTVASTTYAGASTSEDLFLTFSACDRTFFEHLGAERGTWSRYMRLATRDNIAYPVVPNRLREGQRIQMFDNPIRVDGVELIGYYDESSEIVDTAKFAYWGFIANGVPDQVVESLKPHIFGASRLVRGEDGTWARSERRYVGDSLDQWSKETIPSNVPPKQGTVERALLIDDNEPLLGKRRVQIECTVQGALTPTLLQRLRPDLDEESMP